MRRLLLFLFLIPRLGLALDIDLTVTNREQRAKTAEPITSGIPFAEGVLADAQHLQLLAAGSAIPAQFHAAARWPDGSVRWLHLDFQCDLAAGETRNLVLRTDVLPEVVTGIELLDQGGSYRINTGSHEFVVAKNELSLFGRYFEVVHGGSTYRAGPDAGRWQVETSGPLKTMLRAEGAWYADGSLLRDDLIRFRARMIFHRGKGEARLLLTFQNNNSFGWDLELGTGAPELVISAARFGVDLLPDGSYVFGSGVEKTWEVQASADSAVLLDSRYRADGSLESGFSPPPALALASPDYYAATGAWGLIAPPPLVGDAELQEDLDRFEKLQRAKVIQADVEDQPGREGISAWGHLAQDIDSWNRYGGLLWGGSYGPVSDNHYDWVYGMYLQLMRTGLLQFADAARVFAKHELDFAIYHTAADGPAYNYQKNWESRPSNDSPDNVFGPGRPSHTWLQGYALHYLLTGDPRGKDGYEELREGLRQYVYESFNGEGYLRTRELRIPGWITENLAAMWRC